MKYTVQPYHFWEGHFGPYFNNLIVESSRHKFLYCGADKFNYSNVIQLRPYDNNCEISFWNKIKCRIINNFKVLQYLTKNTKNGDMVHFIEFEPITYLYFYFFNRNKKLLIIQTIHSIERIKYNSKIKDSISRLQRKIFNIALYKAKKLDTYFVVHYPFHKRQLSELINENKINLIHYPCPILKVSQPKKLRNSKLLIFGIVREDKGIYEFLETIQNQTSLSVTIAGKIMDKRVNEFKNLSHLKFIDKYLEEQEVDDLFETHDFLVLPYGEKYTGGAGPLKDSFAYGTPVITSTHKVFQDIVKEYNVGLMLDNFNNLDDILKFLHKEDYVIMSKNCMNFSSKYDRDYMKDKYYTLYEQVYEK